MNFAQRIRKVRQEKQMTQEQFGELVGKAESTVRAWELGASLPTCKTLIVIAQRTGKTSDYLLGISDESEAAEDEN
jgi:transcriptional regulator with XRE-family HTH domain